MTTTTDLGAVGTDLTLTDDGSHLDHAAELDDLGYGALWISGGQIDRLDRITEVLAATRRIPVVPGIVPTGVFGSDEVAALYRELEDRFPGRFVAGLGAAQRPGALPEFDAYLDRLDGAVPRERRLLAALGPRKLAQAAEKSAGAITLLVTPGWVPAARAALGPDRTLVVQMLSVLGDDADRAREAARPTLGFLLGVAGYRANVRRMGFTDDDMDAVSDRLVDAVVAHGGPDEIAGRVAAHHAAGADHVAVSRLGATGTEGARPLAGALL